MRSKAKSQINSDEQIVKSKVEALMGGKCYLREMNQKNEELQT